MNDINIQMMFDSDKQAIKDGIANAQIEIGALINNYAKTHHRYKSRTGNLTQATQYNITQNIINEYINDIQASYGKYISQGFKSWQPDPFIEHAIAANQDKIEEILVKHIDRALYGRA